MKILFWNVQSGNPLEATSDQKGGQIQAAVLQCSADMLIFCEALDAAMDFSEIFEVERAIVLEKEAEKRRMPGPMRSLGPLKGTLINCLSHESTQTTRARYRFQYSPCLLRDNKDVMSEISRAARMLDEEATANLMQQPSIQEALRTTIIPPIMREFPYCLASDAVQQNRNYLAYSKTAFKHRHRDVSVEGAKRQLLFLELPDGKTVCAVHAPAFAKGGGETVLQLVGMISTSLNPMVAIGDMNIDLDEIWTEVELEGSGQQYNKWFSSTKVRPIGPTPDNNGRLHKRRWHAHKPAIRKTHPPTQTSGGTLDYVLAKAGMVEIVIPPGVYSDHAAILATV